MREPLQYWLATAGLEASNPLDSDAVRSILPVYRDISFAARRDGVGVIASLFPGQSAVGSDLDKLELDRLLWGNGHYEKPAWRNPAGSRSFRIVECWAMPRPVAELRCIPGEKDAVPLVRRHIVYGEPHRNQLSRAGSERNRRCRLPRSS